MKDILRITYLTETWSYKFMRNTYRHGNTNLDFISTMRGQIRVPMSVQSQDFADDIHVLREIQQQQNSKLWTQITQLFKNFVSKIFQLCNSFFKKLTKTIQNQSGFHIGIMTSYITCYQKENKCSSTFVETKCQT